MPQKAVWLLIPINRPCAVSRTAATSSRPISRMLNSGIPKPHGCPRTSGLPNPDLTEFDHVEIDIHADGFARNLEECGVCGALWSQDGRQAHLIHGATWA